MLDKVSNRMNETKKNILEDNKCGISTSMYGYVCCLCILIGFVTSFMRHIQFQIKFKCITLYLQVCSFQFKTDGFDQGYRNICHLEYNNIP